MNLFVFNSVDLLDYKYHRMGLNRGWLHIDSPKWSKNKKETINPKNNDNKCFHYAVTTSLTYQNIEKDPQRISRIKPLMINITGKK